MQSQVILHELKALYLIERQRDRDLPSASSSPNPTTARAGSGQNQESGAQSGSPTWAAGTHVLEPPPAAPLELAVEGWNSNLKLVYGVQVSQATSQPLGLMPTCLWNFETEGETAPRDHLWCFPWLRATSCPVLEQFQRRRCSGTQGEPTARGAAPDSEFLVCPLLVSPIDVSFIQHTLSEQLRRARHSDMFWGDSAE